MRARGGPGPRGTASPCRRATAARAEPRARAERRRRAPRARARARQASPPSWASGPVAFPDEPEPGEGQQIVHFVDLVAERRDRRCEAAGCDRGRLGAELLTDP